MRSSTQWVMLPVAEPLPLTSRGYTSEFSSQMQTIEAIASLAATGLEKVRLLDQLRSDTARRRREAHELAGELREGLLAFAVGTGLQKLAAIMEDDVQRVVHERRAAGLLQRAVDRLRGQPREDEPDPGPVRLLRLDRLQADRLPRRS